MAFWDRVVRDMPKTKAIQIEKCEGVLMQTISQKRDQYRRVLSMVTCQKSA
jgi:hypothetical protein